MEKQSSVNQVLLIDSRTDNHNEETQSVPKVPIEDESVSKVDDEIIKSVVNVRGKSIFS